MTARRSLCAALLGAALACLLLPGAEGGRLLADIGTNCDDACTGLSCSTDAMDTVTSQETIDAVANKLGLTCKGNCSASTGIPSYKPGIYARLIYADTGCTETTTASNSNPNYRASAPTVVGAVRILHQSCLARTSPSVAAMLLFCCGLAVLGLLAATKIKAKFNRTAALGASAVAAAIMILSVALAGLATSAIVPFSLALALLRIFVAAKTKNTHKIKVKYTNWPRDSAPGTRTQQQVCDSAEALSPARAPLSRCAHRPWHARAPPSHHSRARSPYIGTPILDAPPCNGREREGST
jgi:hypothetical protein